MADTLPKTPSQALHWLRQRPIIYFLLRLVGLFLLWKVVQHTVILRTPESQNAFWGNETLSSLLLHGTYYLLELLGYEAFMDSVPQPDRLWNHRYVGVVGTGLFYMNNPCLAIELMLMYTGLIAAYPGPLRVKLWFIPLGVVFIQSLNVLRFTALSLSLVYFPGNSFVDQHDLFNYVVYVLIFLMWVWFSRRYSSVSLTGR